jgi:hypothetical protein
MANLSSILTALITFCLGMASGIFFLLYCLEEPLYSPVLNNNNNAFSIDSDTQMRRVLMVLQQFLSFRVPIVMVSLITCATLGSALRVTLYGFAPLPVLVALSSMAAIVYSGFLVPSAIKMFKNASTEALPSELQESLAPIVRLHRNVGACIAVTLIIQLTSVAL